MKSQSWLLSAGVIMGFVGLSWAAESTMRSVPLRSITSALPPTVSEKVSFVRPGSKHGLNEMHRSKFSAILNQLPVDVRNSESLRVGCDDSGAAWVIQAEGKNFLFDRRSNRIVHQDDKDRIMNISPDGRTVTAYDAASERWSVFRFPNMVKVFPDDVSFVSYLGRGKYAVLDRAGSRLIGDMNDPVRLVPVVESMWDPQNVYESYESQMLLKRNKGSMALYRLPDFQKMREITEINPGSPYLDQSGDLVVSVRGSVFYVLNRITNEVKGYGLSKQDVTKLLEVQGERTQVKTLQNGKLVPLDPPQEIWTDNVKKVMELSNLQLIEEANGETRASLTERHLGSSLNKRTNHISMFRSPADGLWAAVASAEPVGKAEVKQAEKSEAGIEFWKNRAKGTTVFLNIGKDMEIKETFSSPELLYDVEWDGGLSSVVGRTLDGRFFQVILP